MGNVSAIIVAAGSSSRMGGKVNKPYLNIKGKPALYYSLRTFSSLSEIKEIIVVIRSRDEGPFRKLLKKYNFKNVRYTYGGTERKDSVLNGLFAIEQRRGVVLIHDAARPFVPAALIKRVIKAALKHKAAVPVVPVKDTVKYSGNGKFVEKTLDRRELFLAQTPQALTFDLYMKAVKIAGRKKLHITDDAMLAELAGVKVALVAGDEKNIKLTVKEDLKK